MKKFLFALFVIATITSCNDSSNNQQVYKQPEVIKLNTYEVILQTGDTAYVEARGYYIYNGFVHTNDPTYKFYTDKYADEIVAEYFRPVQVKKIK